MNFFTKIFRANDPKRVSRFHTQRGELVPWSDLIQVPIEILMRLAGKHRGGPWMAKSAVTLLQEILIRHPGMRVLEIGGGSSTLFFAKYASHLCTIEEDFDWANKITEMMVNNKCHFQLEVTNLDEWLNKSEHIFNNFDLVLIDGSTDFLRKKAIELISRKNPSAVYVLDNSDRKIFNSLNFHLQPIRIIRKHGLVRHPFQATETSFYWFKALDDR